MTRLNRAQANEIAQSLDALSVIALNSPEDPEARANYAVAFTHAADAIRILAKQKALTPELNEAYLATGYRVDLNDEQHRMRLVLYQGDEKNVLGILEMASPDAYDMSSHILRKYDTLEGIK